MFWKLQNDTLFAISLIFMISIREYSHDQTLNTERWLDNVRYKSLTSAFVTVNHTFLRFALDITKIKVGAISDTHQFLAADWVIKFKVDSTLRIVSTISSRDVVFVDFLSWQLHDILQEVMHISEKFIENAFPIFWIDKIFDFHLFEFAATENKIAWRNFITEGFSLLS